MPRSVTGDAVTDAIEEINASAADIFNYFFCLSYLS